MRIDRLELVRYGKFTDRVIEFPKAACDFHLIIGPNEAGKSTLRSAVQELLFGISRNSPLDFVHPLSTLRLGATISNAGASLTFQRAKADRKTLRTPADEILADDALAAFVGNADRHFFDQMYGLDHSRLIDGGKSILGSTDSIGQTLFQSAAGIDSMGRIRDALMKERDSLYAPRKSMEREFYVAQAALESATTALKESSVRASIWTEAFEKVDFLAADIAVEVATHKQLEIQRNRLERQRRTAPFHAAVQALEARLLALGEVVGMPAEAGAILISARTELAVASQLLTLRTEQFARICVACDALVIDSDVIAAHDEVLQLAQQRQQYSAHPRDIALRKGEIAQIWKNVLDAGTRLGLSADTPHAMRECLPSPTLRETIDAHALLHGGLMQAVEAARESLATRDDELRRLQTEIATIQTIEVAPTLRASLHAAQAVGSAQALVGRHDADARQASDALEQALKALGPWRRTPEELAAQMLPGEAAMTRLEQSHQNLQTQRLAAARGAAEDWAECERSALASTHYQELYQTASVDAVMHARARRERLWQAIKSQPKERDAREVQEIQEVQEAPQAPQAQDARGALEAIASLFEAAVLDADVLSDRRLAQAKEAAGLQALQQEHQRASARHLASLRECERIDTLQAQLLQRWDTLCTDGGIAGMALEAASEWLAKRRDALAAAGAMDAAHNIGDLHRRATIDAKEALTHALLSAGVDDAPQERLDTLCVRAEHLIRSADAARSRHDALAAQVASLQSVQAILAERSTVADAALARWTRQWAGNLADAGLPPDADVASTRRLLGTMQDIEDDLERIRVLQVDRIDAMQQDLKTLASDALQLAMRLDDRLCLEAPATIAQALQARLAHAMQSADEARRLETEQASAQVQLYAAQEAIRTAQATIEPLLTLARVDTIDMLEECILRSDRKRALGDDLSKQQSSLLQAGDGLSTLQIQDELGGFDPGEAAAALQTVNAALQDAVARRAALAAAKAGAEHVLSDMAGAETGARAEAQRQEALARMSDAAERYVRVATAAKLLSWSIERYREEKQGPMLTQASAVFKLLTLGKFKKLQVDFDKQAMTLAGMREGGELVSIAGMSEGTRDQLYFALRMAALELHLDQASALPFLADDLFINYDDQRAKAGLEALKELSAKTQVIFLSHHDHLADLVRQVFGQQVNVVCMAQ